MRSAARILIVALAAAAFAACQKQQPTRQNQDIAIDDNLAAGQLPANTEIETLPADESSTTPSNQLQKGDDSPDLNDVGNNH